MFGELKRYDDKQKNQVSAPPLGQHRQNSAERAICTFRNHLIAGFITCDPYYLIIEWDRLLPHDELNINLIHNSRVNPMISAWTLLFSTHDFNRVHLAPPGTKFVIHNKPDKRVAWDFRGDEGFYIGPAHDYYRCIRCYISKTRTKCVTAKVTLIPNHMPI